MRRALLGWPPRRSTSSTPLAALRRSTGRFWCEKLTQFGLLRGRRLRRRCHRHHCLLCCGLRRLAGFGRRRRLLDVRAAAGWRDRGFPRPWQSGHGGSAQFGFSSVVVVCNHVVAVLDVHRYLEHLERGHDAGCLPGSRAVGSSWEETTTTTTTTSYYCLVLPAPSGTINTKGLEWIEGGDGGKGGSMVRRERWAAPARAGRKVV